MKVIFLDIDGVLNSTETQPVEERGLMYSIHRPLVLRLNRIVEATGAKIVLSSTWRLADDWHKTMLEAGIADVFLGRTISLQKERFESGITGAEFMERGKEIQEWLDGHPDVDRYCILDDDSDMLPHQKHFKTSMFEGGLTEYIASQVIAYLN